MLKTNFDLYKQQLIHALNNSDTCVEKLGKPKAMGSKGLRASFSLSFLH